MGHGAVCVDRLGGVGLHADEVVLLAGVEVDALPLVEDALPDLLVAGRGREGLAGE